MIPSLIDTYREYRIYKDHGLADADAQMLMEMHMRREEENLLHFATKEDLERFRLQIIVAVGCINAATIGLIFGGLALF